MQADEGRYQIKSGYRPNLGAYSAEAAPGGEYWTPERVSGASCYQYDVYRIAAEIMGEPEVSAVLDVGCGPPMKLASLLPGKPLVLHLVDQAETGPFAARLLPHADFTAADLESIDIDLGRRFDLVVCADVIEHLRDPDPCLTFIRQHLAPGGRLLISTPERDILRGRECLDCPHPAHVREWNRDEFARFLRSRDWRVLGHEILPQQRTSAPLRLLGRTLDRLGFPPSWYSCQLALCRPA